MSLVAESAHLSMATAAAAGIWIESADEVDLRADVEAEDEGGVFARIDAAAASVSLRRRSDRLVLLGGHAGATLRVRDQRLEFEVSELRFQQPAVDLSGRALSDPRSDHVSLDLEGRDLRVAPILAAAAFFAPGAKALSEVADVLRDGVVSEVSVSAAGSSPSDLARFEAFRIGGRLQQGVVQLPLEGVRLENASGDVVIENGVLAAKNVAARVGGSRFREGVVRVGLTGRDRDLLIESRDAHLDLEELHSQVKEAGWLNQTSWSKSRLAGSANVTQLSFAGPVGALRKWRVLLEGSVDGLKIESSPWSEEVELRAPLAAPEFRFSRENERNTTSGRARAGGVECEFEMVSAPDRFEVSHLRLRDARSDATLRVVAAEDAVDVGFSGALVRETLDALLVTNPLLAGSIRGDFQARLRPAEPRLSTANGHCEATDLTVPGQSRVHVQKLSLDAAANRCAFDVDADAPATGNAKLAGTIVSEDKKLVVDATLRAGDVDLAALLPTADGAATASAGERSADAWRWRDSLRGKVDVRLDSLRYQGLRWKPLRAAVSFGQGDPALAIQEARSCGIAIGGTVGLAPHGVNAAISLTAKDEPIEQSVSCLLNRQRVLTGVYDLEGKISAAGAPTEIVRALTGTVRVEARQGIIHDLPVIARTLAAINVVTGGVENLAEIRSRGLAYDRISLRAELKNGSLHFDESALQGPTLKMTGRGSVDLATGTLDLTLMVAPLRTVDSVVGQIPLVGGILGGSRVSIPVAVRGRIDAPAVTPLDPSAVGAKLKGLMERSLSAPGRALRPLRPGNPSK
jgi:hypothetical protein